MGLLVTDYNRCVPWGLEGAATRTTLTLAYRAKIRRVGVGHGMQGQRLCMEAYTIQTRGERKRWTTWADVLPQHGSVSDHSWVAHGMEWVRVAEIRAFYRIHGQRSFRPVRY